MFQFFTVCCFLFNTACIKHYSVKNSDENSANNYVPNYKLIDLSLYIYIYIYIYSVK